MNTNQKTILANLINSIEKKERTDGSKYVVFNDETFTDSVVRELHEGAWPKDCIFEAVSKVVERLADYDDADDVQDVFGEIADGCTPIYNSDLYKMAYDMPNIIDAYLDEHKGEQEHTDFASLISASAYYYYESILCRVWAYVEEQAEGLEELEQEGN